MLQHFVPAADEVLTVWEDEGEAARFFRRFKAQDPRVVMLGDYRVKQGLYLVTASGRLLQAAVGWTSNPAKVVRMLKRGLNKYGKLTRSQRLGRPNPVDRTGHIWRLDEHYPVCGLVLRAYFRDLPRKRPRSTGKPWLDYLHNHSWNQDYAWFTRQEARRLIPHRPVLGACHDVPQALIRRLARAHLVDNVRSLSDPFADGDIQMARVTAKVVHRRGRQVTVRFEGEVRISAAGSWYVDTPSWVARRRLQNQQRGFDGRLLGKATYDLARKRFSAFELIAMGDRWGGTAFNQRGHDLGPAPIGFAFVLADESAAARVAPYFAAVYADAWKLNVPDRRR